MTREVRALSEVRAALQRACKVPAPEFLPCIFFFEGVRLFLIFFVFMFAVFFFALGVQGFGAGYRKGFGEKALRFLFFRDRGEGGRSFVVWCLYSLRIESFGVSGFWSLESRYQHIPTEDIGSS